MSRRLQLLEADIQAVTAACLGDPTFPFQGIESTERAISFLHIEGSEVVSFNLNMSEDYPDNTILTCSKRGNEPESLNERIPVIVQNLAKVYANQEVQFHLPDFIPKDVPDVRHTTQVEEITRDISDDVEEELEDSCGDQQMAAENLKNEELEIHNDESDEECHDDDDDDYDMDHEGYYDDPDDEDAETYATEEEEELNMHPLLTHDIEQVKKHYGQDSCSFRTFGSLGDVDVDLNIDVSFLQDYITCAWNIRSKQPLIIRLHFSLSKYLDAHPPIVEVFQPPNLQPCCICNQLRKIAEAFLTTHWKHLSNDSVQDELRTIPPLLVNRVLLQERGQQREILPRPPSCTQSNPHLSRSKSAELHHLAFSASENRRGLFTTQISEEKKSRKRLFPWQRSSSHNGLSPPSYEDLHLIPAGTLNGKASKEVPPLEYGFLYQLYVYLKNRIPTLSEFCVVCDEPHIFQNGVMLKPAVCQRELCVFSFQTLGVMQDSSINIAAGAEVVDLLVAMVASAVRSKRKNIIFDPYPMVVDPRNAREFAFSPKKKNYQRIEQSLDSFISMREMLSAATPSDVKTKMDWQDVLAFPLLQWIISSNRSHIVKLPPNKQIKFMRTSHQFLLMSSPPNKEASFQKAKEVHGSIFAFHGSNIENWHSILRNGLIMASGTKHQMHGAAYGKGIYLSPHSSVSFGYSGMGHGVHNASKSRIPQQRRAPHQPAPPPLPPRENLPPLPPPSSSRCFLESKNLRCIALCEVINSKELTRHNHVWVCTNPDHVCTRFFFVYEDGKVGDQGVDTTQEKFIKEILVALAEIQS